VRATPSANRRSSRLAANSAGNGPLAVPSLFDCRNGDVTAEQYDLVVSAENSDYMAWQCMVLHHSSLAHLGHAPIFVVHGDEAELVDGFGRIAAAGGRIQRAPNFRHGGEIMYAPRNQMKTVELVATDKPWLVLCDADMIFLDRVDFGALIHGVDEETIVLDRIPFLVVHDENRKIIEEVCGEAAISVERVEDQPISGATPYLVATSARGRLCEAWEPLMEAYLRTSYLHYGGYEPGVWISSMWGLVLAMHSLGLEAKLVDLCVHTEDDPIVDPALTPILHYSYPNEAFNKRRYNASDRFGELWEVRGVAGHTSGAVCDAIRQAGQWFQVGARS